MHPTTIDRVSARAFAILVVAPADQRVRIEPLITPSDGFLLQCVRPEDAPEVLSSTPYDACVIDANLADAADLVSLHADLLPARPIILLTADEEVPLVNVAAPDSLHVLPWVMLTRQTLLTTIRCALRCHAALEARQQVQRELRVHLEALPHPAYVWRSTGADDFRLVTVNEAALRLTKGRIAPRLGAVATDLFSHRPDIVATMRQCFAERRPVRREGWYRMRTLDEDRYLSTTYAFVPPDTVIGHSEDVTERKRAEAALIERDREFHALFENAKDAILIANDDARFVNGNAAALSLLGVPLDRLQAMCVPDVFLRHAAGFEPVWTEFIDSGHQQGRMQLRRSDGTPRTVDFVATANFTRGRHLWVLRDVTDRVELERELQHVQRLDSVGRLAGGIAHDFNNLLTAIIGFADLLLTTFPANDPRRADVREIQRAAESAASLTRQLLAFSRKQVLQTIVFDVNDHIASTTSLLRRLLGEAVLVQTTFNTAQLHITADPTQLEQIVMNLAINARDAMPTGGTLKIATDRVVIQPGTVRDGVQLVPGAYASLTISDTGHGMPPETLAHLFEPFFTTKTRGNGTGLGLATVYGIVKQSGGYIWVTSRVGAGTSFELLFPESTASPQPDDHAEPSLAGVAVKPTTVLVVDDDRAVRALAVRTLEREGFTVVQASSASDALDRFVPSTALLLTDVVMPDMSGVQLATTLAAQQPDLKILFMSGYAADALSDYGKLPGNGDVLAKPFSPDLLVLRTLGALGRSAD